MRHIFLMMAVAFLASSARAQSLDIQHGRVSPGTTGLTIVQGAQPELKGFWRVGADLQLMLRPLVLTDSQGKMLTSVVSTQLGLHLRAAWGLTDRIDVAASLATVPYEHINAVWHQGGFLRIQETASGIGDLWLQSRILLARQSDDTPVSFALCPVLHVPSFATAFMSDGTFAFAPEAQLARKQGPLLFAGNLSVILRPSTVVDGLTLDNQIGWRLGAGYDLGTVGLPERSQLTVETFGLTELTKPFSGPTPVEWLVSGRYAVDSVLATVGVGSGLSGGYGAPQFRVLMGVTWAPEPPAAPPVPPPPPDRDHDGIDDAHDTCPDQPETVNNFQDNDGCPDVADRDNDGVADDIDKCPDLAEDKDGFEDGDGCPDPDNDGDSIPDHLDKCPDEAEDFDGINDEDGCPEKDQDNDGIPDEQDKCPTQAEVINGVQDEDGCPDEGESLVELKEDTVELKGTVFFGIGSAELLRRADAELNQLVALLRNHQALHILVEGYADSEGSKAVNLRLSKRRAESVRKYVMSKGISGERIKTVGYGETHPRAANTDSRSRSLNRRVTIQVIKTEVVKKAVPAADAAPPPAPTEVAPPPPPAEVQPPPPPAEVQPSPPSATPVTPQPTQ